MFFSEYYVFVHELKIYEHSCNKFVYIVGIICRSSFLKKKIIFFPLHIYSPVNYTPTKMTAFTVVLFIILTAIKKVTC